MKSELKKTIGINFEFSSNKLATKDLERLYNFITDILGDEIDNLFNSISDYTDDEEIIKVADDFTYNFGIFEAKVKN